MRATRLQAIRILNHPDRWQVCGGCEAIINRKCALCPHCKHYHSDTSAAGLRRALTRRIEESGSRIEGIPA